MFQSNRSQSPEDLFPYGGIPPICQDTSRVERTEVPNRLLPDQPSLPIQPGESRQCTVLSVTGLAQQRLLALPRVRSDWRATYGSNYRCYYYPYRPRLYVRRTAIEVFAFADRYVETLKNAQGAGIKIGTASNISVNEVIIRVRQKGPFGIPSFVDTIIRNQGDMIGVEVVHYDYLGLHPVIVSGARVVCIGSVGAGVVSLAIPPLIFPTLLLCSLSFLLSWGALWKTKVMPEGHESYSKGLFTLCLTCLRRTTFGLHDADVTWALSESSLAGGF